MPIRRPRPAPNAPDPKGALTASGRPLVAAGMGYVDHSTMSSLDKGWSNQAWGFYETIGPLNYGVGWRAQAMSRVHMRIAEIVPDSEPEILETGPAVEILRQLTWHESTIMSDLSLNWDIAGRAYLIGQDDPDGGLETQWTVYSADQVRLARDSARRAPGVPPVYEIQEHSTRWIAIPDALVVVVRNPDPRLRWRDTSTVKAALPILREIDLYDKDIISSLVSRIANNGILFVPSEVSFPSRNTQNDNEDPFVLELIEAAQQSIKDPGSASAAIPLPLRVPAQFIDKFVHLKLSEAVDASILEARKDAFGRLADTINLPRTMITGERQNHWNDWFQEESAVKTHITPTAEEMLSYITTGFLYPQLEANGKPLTGPGGGRLVVFPDTSALVLHPDLSEKAVELYDRVEISADALRRETGFTDEDAPDMDQIREQLLKKATNNAALALTAIAELTGVAQLRPGNARIVPKEPGTENRDDEEATDRDPTASTPANKPGQQGQPAAKKTQTVGTR